MTRVVVVGFGPHGIAVAAALTEAGARVTVVDPEAGPLAAWRRRAGGIGMTTMRSPWVHHVGTDSRALIDFTGSGWDPALPTPRVAEFESHALSVAAGLTGARGGRVRHLRDRVIGLERAGRWRVLLADGGAVHADRVVVAVGLDPHRRPGPGGYPLPDHALSRHRGCVAVVGGGYTATTAARTLLESGATVDLFAPAGLIGVPYDVEPGWFGPRFLDGYARTSTPQRAVALRQARRATTPPGLLTWLCEREREGRLRVHPERVLRAGRPGASWQVQAERTRHGYETVYAATGHRIDVANIGWLAPWVAERVDGWPVLDSALQAAPGLHLLGPLAELELGPAGRNLWGAQRAAKRVAAHLTASPG